MFCFAILQALQRDIESHSKIVSAVLKLCERIQKKEDVASNQLLAVNLERRWHAIWLQSLEWQCRLEDAINQRKVRHKYSNTATMFTPSFQNFGGRGGR